jgi:DNA-binding transcriptional LysR family regulator
MLDIRQLHYFIAVAEEEHVGRAAERLHISQSPLSRQIVQLEEKLGLTLFERSQQRIRLTKDGRVFLAEAKAFLTHAARLEAMANRLGKGEEGGLCIGYTDKAFHSGILTNALRELRSERGSVHIALYNRGNAEQLEGLRQRSLDVALVCEALPENADDLVAERLFDDPMLLAMPTDHPLAQAGQLAPADLAAQKWIGTIHEDDAFNHLEFARACARAGFAPDVIAEAPEPLAAMGLVAAGLGVTMIQHSLRHQAHEGVVLRELPWFTYRTSLWVVSHKVILRPLVAHFCELLRNGSFPGPGNTRMADILHNKPVPHRGRVDLS